MSHVNLNQIFTQAAAFEANRARLSTIRFVREEEKTLCTTRAHLYQVKVIMSDEGQTTLASSYGCSRCFAALTPRAFLTFLASEGAILLLTLGSLVLAAAFARPLALACGTAATGPSTTVLAGFALPGSRECPRETPRLEG